MGMFDSVYFDCAKCGHLLEEQSKAREYPSCDGFHPMSVPVCIAADLVGDTRLSACARCGARHYIEFERPDEHVAVKLVLIAE